MILFYPEAGSSIFICNTYIHPPRLCILSQKTLSSEQICLYDHLFNPGVINLKINKERKKISAGKIKYQ
jgi:hypothetical protein